ncbi:hypothetical protein BGZ83_001140 [Gryganskiella cystojenkinii]|nr:hypothetical protein BGZ83_001140 [Gryganskiella cystojenkinii]
MTTNNTKGRSLFSMTHQHIPPLGLNRSQVNIINNNSNTPPPHSSSFSSSVTTTAPSLVMSTRKDDHLFKKPSSLLLSTAPNPAIKRKPSKSELNPVNKVHLKRQPTTAFLDSHDTENHHRSRDIPLSSRSATPLSERSTTPSLENNTEAFPRLILAPFEPAPWLEFGKVVIGAKKTVTMVVENPSDRTERLTLDSTCKMEEKGFNISQLDPILSSSSTRSSGDNATPMTDSIILQPRSTIEIDICWTPLTVGSIRASAILKTNSGRFMVNLRGRGDFPVPEYQGLQNSRNPLGASVRSINPDAAFTPRSSSVSIMKQSMMRHSVIKNDLASSTSTQPPPGGYSTLPYVTTNDMYDEKWIDKQERSFSQWLNYEFHATVDEFSAKDPSSWSYYSHKLEFEHTRASACKIYQSDTFRIVLRKVEESIAKDRLQLRADCNLVGDIGARREIIDLIFSFDIRWLVLGLETITGKETAMNPNFDRATISGFINRAIFHDKQLAAEFEPDRILSNRPKFNQAMNRLILKRVFMLILFLDKAKMARLIPSDPCLFNKDSEVKSCRSMLFIIAKNYLMGEGDIIRHLLFMGYSVLHTQTPLDEYEFMVKNLAVDLRDGVRLCRLIDLHFPELSLSMVSHL